MPSSPQKVKFFMYLLFFMLGIVVSVIIVTNANLSMKYAWIPFLSTTVIITLLILLFDKDEVSLRSLMLAAVGSVVGAFMFSIFGIISGTLLSFQGLAALLGLGAGASGMAAGAAVAAGGAAAAVGGTAVLMGQEIPWDESVDGNIDDFQDAIGGGRRRHHRRGGRKFLWRW
jgi:hypothetical protein